VVTSLVAFAPLLVAALSSFRARYPDVVVRFLTGDRVFRLEYGEAHVALRAGPAPQEPDNVVQAFARQDIALYAHADYVARKGLPEGPEALAEHEFVAHDDPENRAPFYRWLNAHVPFENVVFRSTDSRVLEEALLAGAGIGFMGTREAGVHPELVQVMGPQPDWTAPLWLVTHVDLHRTAKVQAFLAHLKAFAGEGSAR
jgi:DNA-binding transcriptional LysR family regulator